MWALADKRWGFEKNPNNYVFTVKIFMFGFCIYGFLIIFSIFGWLPDISEFVKEAVFIITGVVENVPREYELLVLSIPVSVVFILLWLYLVEIDAFTVILGYIRVIKPVKQTSIIELALERPPNSILVVRILDVESGRSYKGELRGYEELNNVYNILLIKVEICDLSCKVLDNAERFIYSCPTNKLQFEVITIKEKK